MTGLEKALVSDISHEMFTIYTTTAFHCPFCERAKAKLTELGHPFVELDTAQPMIREDLRGRAPAAKTVPQIFLGQTHIGGCDELLRLANSKVLDLMIEAYTQ